MSFRTLAPLTPSDRDVLIAFGKRHGTTVHIRPEHMRLEALYFASEKELGLVEGQRDGKETIDIYYDLKRHNVRMHFSPIHFVQGKRICLDYADEANAR